MPRLSHLVAIIAVACAVAGVAGAQDRRSREGPSRAPPRAERAAPYRGPAPGMRGPSGYSPGYGPGSGYGRGPVYAPPPVYGGVRRPNSLGADWREQQDEARAGVRQGQLMPLGRVIEGLRTRTGGRQLDAGLEFQDGRQVYRLRWVTRDGRRIDYIIDAASGAILRGR